MDEKPEIQAPPVAQFPDIDALTQTYVKEHGPLNEEDAATLERLKSAVATFRDSLDSLREGPKDPKAAIDAFRGIISFIELLREIRGAEPDAEFTKFRDHFQMLGDILDPERRPKVVANILREKVFADPTTSDFEPILKGYHELPEGNQKQIRYMLQMVSTEDAIGIILRGSVLIEATLDECIYAYVPNPYDLFSEIRMFADNKIRLAHMLGIITKSEKEILEALNGLRNKIAHTHNKPGDSNSPGIDLTWAEEKSYWSLFQEKGAMGAGWPEYDKDAFPRAFRRIFFGTYMALSYRAGSLAEKRLSEISAEVASTEADLEMQVAMTVMLLRICEKLGTSVLDRSSSASGAEDLA